MSLLPQCGQYWRDNRDRITAFRKNYNPGSSPLENGRGDRFSYDSEGQLTDGWYNALDPAGNVNSWTRKDHFSYDAMGNRQGGSNNLASRNSGQSAISFIRRDNGLNQYTHWWPAGSDYAIYHDDNYPGWSAPGNGVMMAEGWITASYNALNQPVAIWSFAYQGTSNFMWFGYDPLGRCVKRWVGDTGNIYSNPATYFHYDGWNMLQEGNNAWGPARVYAHGNRIDEIVWSQNTFTGEQAFHHYDARGHATLLTDSTGGILEQYEYDAFGQPYFYDSLGNSTTSSVFGNRFLFTSREWLADIRLYDYRNRLYQPELGRFLQPDPKHFTAGDYNLYRYCHNDPINKSDPLGLLEYKFEKGFPVNTPGGRKAIERAIEKYLRNTERGRQLLKAPGTVVIRQVNERHPTTGTSFDPRKGSSPDFETFVDPTDSRFQDRATFRQLYKHPGELPPDNDKGRAAIIGHEFEHGVDKVLNEIQTIMKGENPVRDELEIPLRRSSNGDQVPYPYK